MRERESMQFLCKCNSSFIISKFVTSYHLIKHLIIRDNAANRIISINLDRKKGIIW